MSQKYYKLLEEDLSKFYTKIMKFPEGTFFKFLEDVDKDLLQLQYPSISYEEGNIRLDMVDFLKLQFVEEFVNRAGNKYMNDLLAWLGCTKGISLSKFEEVLYLTISHNQRFFLIVDFQEVPIKGSYDYKIYTEFRFVSKANLIDNIITSSSLIIDFAKIVAIYDKDLSKTITFSQLNILESDLENRLKLYSVKAEKSSKRKIYNRRSYKTNLKERLELSLGIYDVPEVTTTVNTMLAEVGNILKNSDWTKEIKIKVEKDGFSTEEKIKSTINKYKEVEKYVSDYGVCSVKYHEGSKASVEAIKKKKY